jgi:S-adenosylmethionine uptake transporter
VAAAFVLAPLTVVIGETPHAHPSIAFLLRAWSMPGFSDVIVMLGLGLIWAGGVYFAARAYSIALASVVAQFEYVTLPINIMWGFLLWRDFPAWTTLSGAGLTLLSGLYVLYREQKGRVAKMA